MPAEGGVPPVPLAFAPWLPIAAVNATTRGRTQARAAPPRTTRERFRSWWRRLGGGGPDPSRGAVVITLRVGKGGGGAGKDNGGAAAAAADSATTAVVSASEDLDEEAAAAAATTAQGVTLATLRQHPHVRSAAIAVGGASFDDANFDVVVDATAGVEPSALVASVRMALAQHGGARLASSDAQASAASSIPRVQILPAFGAGSVGIEHARAATITLTLEDANAPGNACTCDGQQILSRMEDSDVVATRGDQACVVVRDSSVAHRQKPHISVGSDLLAHVSATISGACSRPKEEEDADNNNNNNNNVLPFSRRFTTASEDNVTAPLLGGDDDADDGGGDAASDSILMYVRGMQCASCAKWVREALLRVPGVASAEVQRKDDTAGTTCVVIQLKTPPDYSAMPTLADLAEAVWLAGYDLQTEAAHEWESHGGGAATSSSGWWRWRAANDASAASPEQPGREEGDVEAGRNSSAAPSSTPLLPLRFVVRGMTCASCARAVRNALTAGNIAGFPTEEQGTAGAIAIDPISGKAHVDLVDARAFVASNGASDVVSAVAAAGYEATELEVPNLEEIPTATSEASHLIEVNLFVDGIVCASCPPRIENAVRRHLERRRGFSREQGEEDDGSAPTTTTKGLRLVDVHVDYVTSGLRARFEILGDPAAVLTAAAAIPKGEGTDADKVAMHRVDPQRSLEWQVATIVGKLGYASFPWRRHGGHGGGDGSAARTARKTEWVSNAAFAASMALVMGAVMLLQMQCEKEVKNGSGARAADCLILSAHAELLLATMQLLGPAGLFWIKRALRALRHGSANMATLVVLGAGTAYIYSVIILFREDWWWGVRESTRRAEDEKIEWSVPHGSLMFDCVAFTIAIVTVGKMAEEYTKAESVDASTKLAALLNGPVTLMYQYRPEGMRGGDADAAAVAALDATCVVDASFVEPGDIVRVRPGERIPVDGDVIGTGASAVDERVITGESVPRPVGHGSKLVGGSVNSGDEAIFFKATASRDTSYLQTVAIAVDNARAATSTSASRIADRVAGFFAPVVILTALAAGGGWLLRAHITCPHHHSGPPGMCEAPWSFALHFLVATVISACPCALGLASPAAVSVGAWVAARRGIFVKGGSGLEDGAHVRKVVFDKTGTLTTGEMVVSTFNFHVPGGRDEGARGGPPSARDWSEHRFDPRTCESDAWRLVQLAEDQSNHPVAKALAAFATEQQQHHGKPSEEEESGATVRNLPGLGAFVRVGRWCALVGNHALMRRARIAALPDDDAGAEGFGGGDGASAPVVGEREAAEGITAAGSHLLPVFAHNDTAPATAQRGVLPGAHCTKVYVAVSRGSSQQVASDDEEAWFQWLQGKNGSPGGTGSVRATSLVPLAIGGDAPLVLRLVVGLTDPVRVEAPAVVAKLEAMGVKSYLCTGDQRGAALHAARLTGIPPNRVVFGASPTRKAEYLKGLQSGGAAVAFVGDGVNDAPALAVASFGIAVGGATDIAASAARCVVTSEDLSLVVGALRIARKTVSQVRFNLVEAVVYNVIVLPLAAGAWFDVLGGWRLSPSLGAVLMSLSSFLVMGSSLFLLIGLRNVA